MGGVNVDGGGKGGRRQLDTEINMIPMIDLLMVTISFLLITAVWVQSSRIDANANVPGPATTRRPAPMRRALPASRRRGSTCRRPTRRSSCSCGRKARTVVRTAEVPREASRTKVGKDGKTIVAFPALAARITEEWKSSGVHRDPTDKRFDKAVVHAGNDMPYGEIVAVMDAVSQPKRAFGTRRSRRADRPRSR